MKIESEIVNLIQKRDFEAARLLIQKGEKIDKEILKQPYFELPVNQLITARQFDIIELWLADNTIETDVYAYDSFNRTIFDSIFRSLPIEQEALAFLTRFIGKLQNINDDIQDQTLLGYALEIGADVAIVKCLIDAGCEVNYINNAEQSLLFEVVSKRMLAPEKAVAYITLLIAEGVEVNKANVELKTPLMVAVGQNKKEYLDLLLENGADPNEQDKDGKTAFYQAIAEQSSVAVFEKLLAYATPDFELQTRNGETAFSAYLRMLYNNNNLALLPKLLEAGADLSQHTLYYDKPKTGYDWLAEKSFETLEIALSTGRINLNEQDAQGETLLHKVCAFDINLDEQMAKDIYKKVKLLIEAGAEVNLTNNKDESPLMLAGNNNKKAKTVQLLLSHSAS